jgi:PAS domain S-box-containing protein
MSPQSLPPEELGRPETIDRVPTRALLDALGKIYDLVLVTDFDGLVLWTSNGLTELCGGAGFHVGREAQAILPQIPDLPKPEQVFTLRSQLRQQGFLSNVRVELPARAGGSVPVEVNILPVSTHLEKKPFYVVIGRPIEECDRASSESHDKLLAATLEASPEALLTVDARGFVTYVNSAGERLIGDDRAQILNRPVAALLSDAGDLEQLVSSLGAERTGWELKLMRGDGSTVHVAASAQPQTLQDGSFGGSVLHLHDVTAQREAAEALESRNAELERSNRQLQSKNAELEHGVNALAHDLRSPLVALLGFSRLLQQDYGPHLDDTGTHFVDRIEQAGRTMEDLIHDLLELSRIGQPGERRSLVDPKSVLNQLQAELKPRLDAAGTRLELPQAPPLIYCDRTRLYQVFSNLIGNAIDHMGACDDPHIVVSIVDEADRHHISVRDFGQGIAVENHERVFDVFQSIGVAADGRSGTGIGLAIVKKIAETHGGQVWLESQPGGGATFHVSLPHA